MKTDLNKHRIGLNLLKMLGTWGLIVFLICSAQAQENGTLDQTSKPRLCGGYSIDKAALKSVLQYEKSHNKTASPAATVRLFFHICRDDQGGNVAITQAQLTTEFNNLIADYLPGNICFASMGFDYINNTTLNNSPTASLASPYVVPNAINIFFHYNMPGAGGNAWNIPNTFCSVNRSNLGASRSTSHELGHCLGLYHTFEPAFGYEMINGGNSASSADFITDTKADPYAYNGNACFGISSCGYTGTCTDPNGAINFMPPYDNTMAYWPVERLNRGCSISIPAFTAAQFTRILSFLNNNTSLSNCTVSNSTFTLSNITYSGGYNWLTAINSVTTSGNVLITGNASATLSANLVVASPGFVASPGSGGLILFRPSTCSSGSGIPFQRFVSTKDQPNDQFITINPNPFTSSFDLTINAKNTTKAQVSIFNSLGMKMKTLPVINVSQGRNQITVEGSSFSKGVYLVEVRIGNEKVVKKIVKL